MLASITTRPSADELKFRFQAAEASRFASSVSDGFRFAQPWAREEAKQGRFAYGLQCLAIRAIKSSTAKTGAEQA